MPTTLEPTPEQVLALWTERDLSAQTGELPPAFEMSEMVENIASILGARRNVLLVGESGVGKSALVYELVRRLPSLEAMGELRMGRVVQLSIALRMSRLKQQSHIFEAFAQLMDALALLPGIVLVFIRDGDLLPQLGLSSQLESMCLRNPQPMIIEGRPGPLHSMLEDYEGLEQHFTTLPVMEPDLRTARRILERWARETAARRGDRFDASAIDEAVYLTHRFLSRSRLPRKAIDLLANTVASRKFERDIAVEQVIDRFCTAHRTPRWLVDPALGLNLDELDERLREQLLGQEEAVSAALSTIALIKSGLSDMRRPFAVFLFVGPTGVGKTHLAQTMAAELFGARDRMVRINMGDFSGARGAEALFGDPEHHLASNRRGVLTQRLLGRPFGVLLLDEFEKAHVTIHDRLLPLIDEGQFVNGAGEMVSCRSNIIIATSNAGAEVYRESALGFTTPADLPAKRDELERRVRSTFRFELLNRFDRVVHFNPLTREDIRELARRELAGLEARPGLRRANVNLEVDDAVLDWLANHGYDAQYGARFLKRTIEREVTSAIADSLVRNSDVNGQTISLEVRRNRVRARIGREVTGPMRVFSPSCALDVAQTDGLTARALLERCEHWINAHERDVIERDRLLAEMATPELWDDRKARESLVEQFRVLDVTCRIAQRFARPLQRLRVAADGGEPEAISVEMLNEAATAIRRWEERERLEGVRALWLVLSAVPGESPAGDWLRTLARMYLGWCRRIELQAQPVAFELESGDVLNRLVLEVVGPGAEHYLDAERGVHRQRRSAAPYARVRVDLVQQGSEGVGVDIKDRAVTRGPFGLIANLETSLRLKHTGQTVRILGASRATLAGLVGDLGAAWASLRIDSPEVVRSYGEAGGVVLDPRTGVSALQRGVLRGKLEPFFDAWRRRDPDAAKRDDDSDANSGSPPSG